MALPYCCFCIPTYDSYYLVIRIYDHYYFYLYWFLVIIICSFRLITFYCYFRCGNLWLFKLFIRCFLCVFFYLLFNMWLLLFACGNMWLLLLVFTYYARLSYDIDCVLWILQPYMLVILACVLCMFCYCVMKYVS